MKLAKRENNEIVTTTKIENILNLENSQLIQMERGDKLNKDLKRGKANKAFGKNGLFSVKEMKAALEKVAELNAKKSKKIEGCLCCVCTDAWTSNTSGICNDCKIGW